MWLLVGLGNPGVRYSRTRHNIGFMVLDRLAESLGLDFREKTDYRACSGSISGHKVVLMEPLTFMNRSGSAVRKVFSKYTVLPEHIIVIHDDLDLDAGKLKIRKKGSSGGHKGVESVIQNIGTQDFIRVKIGIGRDPLIPTEDYVLSKFRKDEQVLVKDVIARAGDAISCILGEGVEKAMNRFNS
ncbi:MAG: aminoacyl-tRNA hydrolase [Nitrospirae bacterium]|nr:aminoacyl-tRNA hydrolase [Nitrospirota bacterium]